MGNPRHAKDKLDAARVNLASGRARSHEAKTQIDEIKELDHQQKDTKTQIVEGIGAVAKQLADARTGLGQLDSLFKSGAQTSRIISAKAGIAQRHYETAESEAEQARSHMTKADGGLDSQGLPPIQAAHATKNIAYILGDSASHAANGFTHYKEVVCSEFTNEIGDMITRLEELAKSVSALGEPEGGTKAEQIHTMHYQATGANPDTTIAAFDTAIEIVDRHRGNL